MQGRSEATAVQGPASLIASVREAAQQAASSNPLIRERALQLLGRLLQEDGSKYEGLADAILPDLATLSRSSQWESRAASLTVGKAIHCTTRSDPLFNSLLEQSAALLDDPEPRVRLAAGEALGDLAVSSGAVVWERIRARVLQLIDNNWDRDTLGPDATLPAGSPAPVALAPPAALAAQAKGADFVVSLLQTSYRVERPGSGDMRHGTEGWRSLETAFKALLRVIEACGASFQAHATPEVQGVVLRALLHPNRYVRETGYHAAAGLAALGCARPYAGDKGWSAALAERLQDGLTENWSQVRYAACVAARAFLSASGGAASPWLAPLLPHLLFNRHDAAEGVRCYSHDTWRALVAGDGPAWVGRCIDKVVAFLERCARTNNATSREAAAACLGEVVSRAQPAEAVRGCMPCILRTLLAGFRDDAWPVRDAACRACGRCAERFPEETVGTCEALWALWEGALADNIFSVREGGALALSDAVRGGGDAAAKRVEGLLRKTLLRAKDQPPVECSPSDSLPRSPQDSGAQQQGGDPFPSGPSQTSTGLQPAARDAAAALTPWPAGHAAGPALEQGYGAGPGPAYEMPSGLGLSTGVRRTLAAVRPSGDGLMFVGAMARPRREMGGVDHSCGCMDYSVRRPREPWEESDGAVYLLRELAIVRPGLAAQFLPELVELASLEAFAQCRTLQETVWRALPRITEALGKRAFKPHLESFLAPLFRCLACAHPLCRAAAGRCVGALRDMVGPRVFEGRLDACQARLMHASPDVPPVSGVYARVGLHACGASTEHAREGATYPISLMKRA